MGSFYQNKVELNLKNWEDFNNATSRETCFWYNRHMKIALVLPWYGPKPWFWPLFEKSASRIGMDVIVVAEKGFGVAERNFRVIEMSLDELARRAAATLGTEVNLMRGYKLCDLRPMYGVVFADILKDYDYWAYGDCDLVYGRMFNKFLEKATNGIWDVATVKRDLLSGPFTLMRNCDFVNNLFRRSAEWRDVLASSENKVFDEIGVDWFKLYCFERMTTDQIAHLGDRLWTFGSIVWRADDVKFLHEDWICEDGLKNCSAVMHSEGRLMHGGREISIFHFLVAKTSLSFVGSFGTCSILAEYEVTRDGILPVSRFFARLRIRLWHKLCGWSRFAFRVAAGDTEVWGRLRRFVLRKIGAKNWWYVK